MDDALLVGRLQGAGDAFGDGELRAGLDAVPQGLAQGASADQLQEEEISLLALQVAMDAADVGMVELGEEAGFGEEAGPGRVVQPVAADGLERHRPLELLVEALEDGAHASLGQGGVDADVTDAVSGDGHGGTVYKGFLKFALRRAAEPPPGPSPRPSPGGRGWISRVSQKTNKDFCSLSLWERAG